MTAAGTARTLRFTKMQGLGNDFVVVDAAEGDGLPWSELAPRLCDRRRGIGADGVLVVGPGAGGRLSMLVVNADGGAAEMCGNGVRCAAVWAARRGLGGTTAAWDTAAGAVTTELLPGGQVRVDMGSPRFAPADIPVLGTGDEALDIEIELDGAESGARVRLRGLAVGMGNPHCVVPLDPAGPWSLEDAPADAVAAAIAGRDLFPDGVNVELVEIAGPRHVRQRTVERGVGETDACGTGACAVVAALRRAGLIAPDGPVRVALRGGDLSVEWPGSGAVVMTGPAESVFEGEVVVDADGDGAA
ncbi:MAG TPA: diaminopimelate epimerase [Candidatus Dormibacteraeota bacterium]|nr:diaminopimelate epimerase [Candidatus Dormibacteraeota bacterium]